MRTTVILVLISLFSFTGCAGSGLSDSVDFSLASQPAIYLDNWVRLSPVQVYVHPDIAPPVPPKALFVPFRVTQQMENATPFGLNISRMVWQSWLQNKVLNTIEMAQTTQPYRPDIALAMGKQRGADLVVGGYITHFIDGGTVGDSVVSLSIEAYDVHTGNLLWSMAQGGLMPRSNVSDYLLFSTKSRMPADPVSAVVFAIGRDMGLQVRNWAIPQPPQKSGFKSEPKAFN